MRRGDEVELDITRAASRGPHDGWADDVSRGEPGDGAVGDDDAGRDGRAGRERRRWNHPLPWVAVGVGVAVVGAVLATNVPPPIPDGPGLVADQSREPVLQWETQTCGWDAEPTVADDLVLVTGPNCAQALDTRTGEERWRIREPRLTCRATATADIVACLQGTDDRRLVTIDVATGERTEHNVDMRDVADLGPAGADVVTSTIVDDNIELRRITTDERVVWSAELRADNVGQIPEPARITFFGPTVGVDGATQRVLSADGSNVDLPALDLAGRVGAVADDGTGTVYDADGRALRDLVAGEVFPYISDASDPGVRFVSDSPASPRRPGSQIQVQDRSGRFLWEPPPDSWPIAVVDRAVIFMPSSYSSDVEILARELTTGEERWRSQGEFVIAGRGWTDGRLLLARSFGQTRQDVSAIDMRTGEELWEVHLRDSESGGLIDVARDGTLILRTEDGLAGWHSP